MIEDMIIETKRLLLRTWEETDAEALYQHAKDPRIGPLCGWQPHTSVEESRTIIRDVLSKPETYAVVLKETGELAGGVSCFASRAEGAGQGDMEIGYWLGVPYWGKGLMPEAVRALERRCFEVYECSSLWCGYFDGNEKSRRVQEKCGFSYHHTEHDKCMGLSGETHTVYFTRLTRSQWAGNPLLHGFL